MDNPVYSRSWLITVTKPAGILDLMVHSTGVTTKAHKLDQFKIFSANDDLTRRRRRR